MYTSPISLLLINGRRKWKKPLSKLHSPSPPKVDKEELIRALAYDREQYEKGYHQKCGTMMDLED